MGSRVKKKTKPELDSSFVSMVPDENSTKFYFCYYTSKLAENFNRMVKIGNSLSLTLIFFKYILI